MKQINAKEMKSTKVQTLFASHAIVYTEHLAGEVKTLNIIYKMANTLKYSGRWLFSFRLKALLYMYFVF